MANLFRANKKSGGGGVIEVDHITITTQPTKTVYAQYDAPDLTGAQITATFTDGVTADVTNAVAVSPAILSDTGTQTITLTYGGSTATFNVTVNTMTAISVTTLPTKTSYQPNEALDLTGIVVTGTAGALSPVITSGCSFSPANGTILTTEGTHAITVTYHGLTTSFNVTCSLLPASLEDATWAQIQAAVQNGTLSQFANVGDNKTITLTTNETLTLQLARINDGTGTAGTYYPAHSADFISVELMNGTHVMNSTATNVGGWNNCEMRTYLNETVYPTLPGELKATIINKTHMYTAGNMSHDLVSATDKLWLPTTYEMFGENSQYYLDDADHNIHYSIFPDNASRIKYRKAAPTSARYWWLSSPGVNSSINFAYVSNGGSRDANYANDSNGVVLGLRIG